MALLEGTVAADLALDLPVAARVGRSRLLRQESPAERLQEVRYQLDLNMTTGGGATDDTTREWGRRGTAHVPML